MSKVLTCPKCGAIVGKHITNCYQCNTFLLGSRFEGFFMNLLPQQYHANPATSLLILFSLIPFAVVLFIAGMRALMLVPIYNMIQIGATQADLFMMGEYWRVVTANFVHFNILHLGMNTLGLYALGPLVERMFDYRKCMVIFIVSGILTFTVFVLGEVYFGFLRGSVAGGASAGLFGLMGAGVAGAMKHDWRATDLKKELLKSFAQNLVLGLIILPLGSNIMHVYGFIFGFLIAYVTPASEGSLGWQRRIFSYLFLLSLLTIGAAAFLQTRQLLAYPLKGSAPEDSAALLHQCAETEPDAKDSPSVTEGRILQAAKTCDLLIREGGVNPEFALYRLMYYSQLYPQHFDREKLEKQFEVLRTYSPYRDQREEISK